MAMEDSPQRLEPLRRILPGGMTAGYSCQPCPNAAHGAAHYQDSVCRAAARLAPSSHEGKTSKLQELLAGTEECRAQCDSYFGVPDDTTAANLAPRRGGTQESPATPENWGGIAPRRVPTERGPRFDRPWQRSPTAARAFSYGRKVLVKRSSSTTGRRDSRWPCTGGAHRIATTRVAVCCARTRLVVKPKLEPRTSPALKAFDSASFYKYAVHQSNKELYSWHGQSRKCFRPSAGLGLVGARDGRS